MTYDFTLSCALPAAPEALYDAWLDSAAHSAMTGGEAKIGRCVGDRYSAWDGYIEGATLELVAGKRIVQSWRTTEFGASDPDSTIVVDLESTGAGTRLTLTHKGVPDGQTSYENGGWQDNYFAPMKAYFESRKKNAKASARPRSKDGLTR
jgi:activator of HSP90 ATPase